MSAEEPRDKPSNFIREIILEHNASGRFGGKGITRFPPEPNGYLHIGHAQAIWIGFGMAQESGGRCPLRFDDTNPTKESQEYVDAIMEDVRWLGFDWGPHLYHASDYFEQLYAWAVKLIRDGKEDVDEVTAGEVREHRGTLYEAGRESPSRNRPVEESLDLFERMRRGEFEDGTQTLRAKIDMTSGNINLRDPVMYRIRKATHQRTGDTWCLYPMYDWAHGESDSIEGVTHSICTLEYEDHRPLYDWYLAQMALLEHCGREDLNKRAERRMAVLRPLRLVIENYPEGQVEELEAVNNPEDPSMGTRRVPFSRVLYIEEDDFREDPPKEFCR